MCGFRAQASELWVRGEKVSCGYISENSRVRTEGQHRLLRTAGQHRVLRTAQGPEDSRTAQGPEDSRTLSGGVVCSGGVPLYLSHGLHLHPDEQ